MILESTSEQLLLLEQKQGIRLELAEIEQINQ
jgi:hypothetical protein